jgi:hypothetical protein
MTCTTEALPASLPEGCVSPCSSSASSPCRCPHNARSAWQLILGKEDAVPLKHMRLAFRLLSVKPGVEAMLVAEGRSHIIAVFGRSWSHPSRSTLGRLSEAQDPVSAGRKAREIVRVQTPGDPLETSVMAAQRNDPRSCSFAPNPHAPSAQRTALANGIDYWLR